MIATGSQFADPHVADQHSEGYATNAQYYELIFPDEVIESVGAGLTQLLSSTGTVVEVGAGTGMFTRLILDRLSAGAEVFAVEPSPVMRAALATRLAHHPRADGLTIIDADGLTATLPPDIGGVDTLVLLHVLSHFSPEARARLWSIWIPQLVDGGLIVADPLWPEQPMPVPAMVQPGRILGRRRYESCCEATVHDDPAGRPMVQWRMTYRTYEADRLVGEDSVCFPAHVVSRATIDSELVDYGVVPIADVAGVWAWRVSR
ncbi:class I SAM-dependent methyltransferase [Williamsia sp. CHRR-6]|uniref:class I SAM-dependent methyltransferase n=1 Tax=Williamsia sp. CHRR-6 TaxID=2835871 RepID=UPI001BDA3649|nr:class I SAM-dependent methyltransferase [Williamsia sp. CHRR-6]MBT0565611.1 class I SAM-dependent methyltransferase [Williamsia sp. CHRR-6]